MACTIDIEVTPPNNLHPTNKLPIGERLALGARHVAFGEDLVYLGPIIAPGRCGISGDKMILNFDHIGSGLIAHDGGALTGFEVAGSDLVYVAANAQIVGDRVEVSAPTVLNPAAARYAWALYPTCNLSNVEGLPASPFRLEQLGASEISDWENR